MDKIFKIILGCFITSLSVVLFNNSHIATGGTAGLSLMLSYIVNKPFFTVFLIVSIPFFIFGIVKMGWKFTLSSILTALVLTFFTYLENYLPPFTIHPIIGSVIGGLVSGIGVSIIINNGSSLGGTTILAIYLEKKHSINIGLSNFIFDSIVLVFSLYSLGLYKGFVSILSLAVTSVTISYLKEKSLRVPNSRGVVYKISDNI